MGNKTGIVIPAAGGCSKPERIWSIRNSHSPRRGQKESKMSFNGSAGSRGFSLAALAAAAVLATASGAAHASLLFGDNFNVTTPTPTTNSGDVNYNLANRESGSLVSGGTTIPWSTQGNVQVGNSGTGDITTPNYLLVAFGGTASPNFDFNSAGYGPLTISFDMNVNPTQSTDTTMWGDISVGLDQANQLSFVNAGNANDFSILFRSNGGYQAFQGGTQITGGTGSAYWDGGTGSSDHVNFHSFQLVITGANGTGSGLAGNGTEIQVYADGTLFHTFSTAAGGGLGGQLTDNYINFGVVASVVNGATGIPAVGVENVQISSGSVVPEPASLALFASCGLGLLLLKRRKTV